MPDRLEQLVGSLLYEGYALYPYTPAAIKNATPTPFGIAYPPRYAAQIPSAFDHVEMRCILLVGGEAAKYGVPESKAQINAPESEARISAEARFLAATGERHQALAHRLALPEVGVRELLAAADCEGQPSQLHADVDSAGGISLRIAMTLGARQLDSGAFELVLRVENRTACPDGLDRGQALRRSLICVHPLMRVQAGRFISPLERRCTSVNTFPVLASERDDAMLGAAIVLPDHPQVAPESCGGMFDSTEIEEALLLHVKALSDQEREQIEHDDPRVAEMIKRAAAMTPKDVLALHGRVTLREAAQEGETTRDRAQTRETTSERDRFTASPPQEPPGLLDPSVGEAEAEVDGVCFRRGGKVRLRPGEDADLHAQMLSGRIATIERILIDYDGKVHLGVTVDGDPGQDLLRDSGRLLFFFAQEVAAQQSFAQEVAAQQSFAQEVEVARRSGEEHEQ